MPDINKTDLAQLPDELHFNINYHVRVKLTPQGIEGMRRRHQEFYARIGIEREFVPPTVDAEGWTDMQLWCLMEELGADIHIGGGGPIETEIVLDFKEIKARAIRARTALEANHG